MFCAMGAPGFVILVLVWRFWASGWFAWGLSRDVSQYHHGFPLMYLLILWNPSRRLQKNLLSMKLHSIISIIDNTSIIGIL
jgi:hypothetical protein